MPLSSFSTSLNMPNAGWSAGRLVPRKSASLNLYCWIVVPIAPSIIMMRLDISFTMYERTFSASTIFGFASVPHGNLAFASTSRVGSVNDLVAGQSPIVAKICAPRGGKAVAGRMRLPRSQIAVEALEVDVCSSRVTSH